MVIRLLFCANQVFKVDYSIKLGLLYYFLVYFFKCIFCYFYNTGFHRIFTASRLSFLILSAHNTLILNAT